MEADVATTDADLARGLAAGAPGALEAVYRAYADRLFSYACTCTRDRDAAADAVSETFLLAQARIGQLRDPTRLRPWLYAICRNECRRHFRSTGRTTALDEAGQVMAPAADMEAGVTAEEAAALVAAALPALNDSDRDMVELAMRHQLSSEEIGAATGMSTNQASARVSRAKAQLERTLGALLMFRTRGRNCPDLAAITADAEFNPLTRKRVARHTDSCQICHRRRKVLLADLSAAHAWPLEHVPADVATRVLGATGADIAAVDASTPAFNAGGWPVEAAQHGLRHVSVAACATVGLTVALLAVGAVELSSGTSTAPPPTGTPTALATTAPGTTIANVQPGSDPGAPTEAGGDAANVPPDLPAGAGTAATNGAADAGDQGADVGVYSEPQAGTGAETTVVAETPTTDAAPTTPPWNVTAPITPIPNPLPDWTPDLNLKPAPNWNFPPLPAPPQVPQTKK